MAVNSLGFQIGKNGLTPGIIESLELALKNHKQIRISVFKSSGRTRDTMKQIAEEITSKLKENCSYRVIGFTIILKKLRGEK
jgi:RNA-binding protein YhbY